MPSTFRALLALGLALVPACTTPSSRLAASLSMAPGDTTTLRINTVQPRHITLQLWNRGPGPVQFRASDDSVRGELLPGANEFEWSLDGMAFAIILQCGTERATIAYTVRTNGSLEVTTGQ